MLALLSTGQAALATEVILIAGEDDWAPYSSSQPGSDQPHGFSVDVIREAFATQDIQVRFVVVPFSRCLYMARTGAVLACFNTSIVEDNRDTYIWHPTPIFHEDLTIVTRKGFAPRQLGLPDLEGHAVGYTLGYTYPSEIFRNKKIKLVSAKADAMQLEMLQAGRIDYALLGAGPTYLRLATHPEVRQRIEVAGVVYSDPFRLAFSRARPESPRLAQAFERGLQALKTSGRYDKMHADLWKRLGRQPPK